MANKYCNLDGTKKIKDEYKKINIGFDKVEEDLVNIIVTPAEGVSEQEIIQARKGRNTLNDRLNETDTNINTVKQEIMQARKGKATLNDRLNETDTNINTVNNNLNSRIDNIIATPTTISEQEIIDARQGKASLGANLTAIKDDLAQHKLDYMELKKGLIPNVLWEVGGVNLDGRDFVSTNRVRTNYIEVREGQTIYLIESELRDGMVIAMYDLIDKNFIKYQGAPYFHEYYIDRDCYIRIMSRYKDNREITDTSAFNDTVYITNYHDSKIREGIIREVLSMVNKSRHESFIKKISGNNVSLSKNDGLYLIDTTKNVIIDTIKFYLIGDDNVYNYLQVAIKTKDGIYVNPSNGKTFTYNTPIEIERNISLWNILRFDRTKGHYAFELKKELYFTEGVEIYLKPLSNMPDESLTASYTVAVFGREVL